MLLRAALFVSLSLSLAGTLAAQELRIGFAYRSIEVTGVSPGGLVHLFGVTREAQGLEYDQMREWLRDGDGDGRVELEVPRDLPLSIVAAVEEVSGRSAVAGRGIRWAHDHELLLENGVEVFWLRPGRSPGAARVSHSDLEPGSSRVLAQRGVPEFLPGDFVFVVDLTNLRSVLVRLPEESGPHTPDSRAVP